MLRIARSLSLVCTLGAALLLSAPGAAPRAGEAPPGVVVHPGYALEAVVTGLDFPIAIAFGTDQMWVSEAANVPGLTPKVKAIDREGAVTTILVGTDLPEGQLTVVEPRPIANDWDDQFAIAVGGAAEFFGWPDFFHHSVTGAVLPITHPLFCHMPLELPIPCPDFVLDASFRASLTVPRHSSGCTRRPTSWTYRQTWASASWATCSWRRPGPSYPKPGRGSSPATGWCELTGTAAECARSS